MDCAAFGSDTLFNFGPFVKRGLGGAAEIAQRAFQLFCPGRAARRYLLDDLVQRPDRALIMQFSRRKNLACRRIAPDGRNHAHMVKARPLMLSPAREK